MLTEFAASKLRKEEQERILSTAVTLFSKAKSKLGQNEGFKRNLLHKYLDESIIPIYGIGVEIEGDERCTVDFANTDRLLTVSFRELNPDLSWKNIYRIQLMINPKTAAYEGAEIAYHDLYRRERSVYGLAAAAKFEELLEKIK